MTSSKLFWFHVLSDAAVNSGELWFVNFYSAGCSHCHDLAPTVYIFYIPITKVLLFLIDLLLEFFNILEFSY